MVGSRVNLMIEFELCITPGVTGLHEGTEHTTMGVPSQCGRGVETCSQHLESARQEVQNPGSCKGSCSDPGCLVW